MNQKIEFIYEWKEFEALINKMINVPKDYTLEYIMAQGIDTIGARNQKIILRFSLNKK